MKKTAYLINVARGPIVGDLALIAAFRGGTMPVSVVNREVLNHARVAAWLANVT